MTAGRTQALSSSHEVASTAGRQGEHLSFQLRHISNPALHDQVRNETTAPIGVDFDL